MLSIYKYKVNNGRGDHPVRSRLIDEFVVQICCCHQGLSELDFYGAFHFSCLSKEPFRLLLVPPGFNWWCCLTSKGYPVVESTYLVLRGTFRDLFI